MERHRFGDARRPPREVRAIATPSTDVPPGDRGPAPAAGIPVPMGDGCTGVLHATFEGIVQEEVVHHVDSHRRAEVTGHVPAGSVVDVALVQDDPEIDFFGVASHGPEGAESGRVPAPDLSVPSDLDGG